MLSNAFHRRTSASRSKTAAAALVGSLLCAPFVLAQTVAPLTPANDRAPAAPAAKVEAEKSPANPATRERRAKESGQDEKRHTETQKIGESEVRAGDDDAELQRLRTNIESARGSELPDLRLEFVRRLVELNRTAEAIAELRKMVADERIDPPFFYNSGNVLARLGQSYAAADAYRKAISQRRGNYSRAQHNLGLVLIRVGQWDDAEEALKAALRLENNNYAEASYNLGRLYALRGEAGLAINAWDRTLQLKPDHAEACVALARTLADDGDLKRARQVLDAFVERLALRGAEVPTEIRNTRSELSMTKVKAPDRRVDLAEKKAAGGETLALRGEEKQTAGLARRTLRPLEVSRRTYDYLQQARAAREANRNEEAAGLYRRALWQSGGYFPPASIELAYTLAALMRIEEAVAVMLPVTKREGDRYPIAFYHLGRHFEKLGRLDEAVESFARAEALLGSENPQILTDISRVYEKAGKTREAADAIESYVRSMEKRGEVPEWAKERLTFLRQKAAR